MAENRLALEKNPYLLQHASNPVDWRPWGKEAHDQARERDKPIFLSIGYSTCHWCHVMERESFEDADIAALLNKEFVPIKLDREERPDVDKIYMAAVQVLSGRGGWPLNVFLTPDLKPFYGGTYFPPRPRWGMPGFGQILNRVAQVWSSDQGAVKADAERLFSAVRRSLAGPAREGKPEEGVLDGAFKAYQDAFDGEYGGFGGAPKFPVPAHQGFLLRYFRRRKNAEALQMLSKTLEAMAAGGLRDHLGGGFHRYSTDAAWRLPHFEKMLYDNAQLAVNYFEAYQACGEPDFLEVAKETLDYVLRDLGSPEGGFYCGEDADSPTAGPSERGEGEFYLWKKAQINEILGPRADLFCRHYGIAEEGNLPEDQGGEFAGKNLPRRAESLAETAARLKINEADLRRELADCRKSLFEARSRRPRPFRDEKVLCSWNGLMISALAKGFQVSGDSRYLKAAEKTADFIRARLYDRKTGRLRRRFFLGESAVDGFSDDYAFLARGLIDLYEADFKPDRLEWALELSERLLKDFAAPEGGFYLNGPASGAGAPLPILEESDSAEPSPSAVAACVFLRLSSVLDREDLSLFARKTLRRFVPPMVRRPMSLPAMLSSLDFSLSPAEKFPGLVGKLDDEPAIVLES